MMQILVMLSDRFKIFRRPRLVICLDPIHSNFKLCDYTDPYVRSDNHVVFTGTFRIAG